MRILRLILLSLSLTQANGQNTLPNLAKEIELIASENNFSGVIYLTDDDGFIYSKSTGCSDIENKTPLQMSDQFVIGSISKEITAVLILKEYEKGNISLEKAIADYLPSMTQSWAKKVTIHQLLTHTHGIRKLDESLEFEPGTQFKYSQIGYELLARILENVTSNSFEKLATSLFKENDLEGTFHPASNEQKRLVKGYAKNQNGELEFATNSLRNYVPAGSFISSAEDLDKWNRLLHAGKLVKQDTLELMKTNFATRKHPIFGKVQYGYGLLFLQGESNTQIGALGYAPGFVSASYYYPQSDVSLTVLSNAVRSTVKNKDDFEKVFKVHTTLMRLIKKSLTK